MPSFTSADSSATRWAALTAATLGCLDEAQALLRQGKGSATHILPGMTSLYSVGSKLARKGYVEHRTGGMMLRPEQTIERVYLHRAPIDMRRKRSGLAALVQVGQSPTGRTLSRMVIRDYRRALWRRTAHQKLTRAA